LLYGRDIDANLTLFRDVLGFNLTEQVVGPDRKFLIGVFLTCSNKARTIAFFRSDEDNRLHHASFILGGWHEVLHAADIISKRDVSLDIGPTRHGITRGETIYFSTPRATATKSFRGVYLVPRPPGDHLARHRNRARDLLSRSQAERGFPQRHHLNVRSRFGGHLSPDGAGRSPPLSRHPLFKGANA
jgi:catechol 2,3-dioxygenase-like lactoylglutathione lyase family enzyme